MAARSPERFRDLHGRQSRQGTRPEGHTSESHRHFPCKSYQKDKSRHSTSTKCPPHRSKRGCGTPACEKYEGGHSLQPGRLRPRKPGRRKAVPHAYRRSRFIPEAFSAYLLRPSSLQCPGCTADCPPGLQGLPPVFPNPAWSHGGLHLSQ